MIPVHLLRPGTRWKKSISGKRYEVLKIAIDVSTSQAVVIYKKLDDNHDDDWLVRPVGEFLGTQLDLRVGDETLHTYVRRYVPISDGD